jgi:microcystin degradation protein MlrC
MRAVTAQFLFEANTFSPLEVGMDMFRDGGTWLEGAAAVRRASEAAETQTGGSLRAFEAAGWSCDPVFLAVCGSPSGRLSRACFAEVREAFRRCLGPALPADAVVLHLHGAASAVGEDDVEGALLSLVRDELGHRGRLVLSLDLHANLTRRMSRLADAITAYRTMPHVDLADSGARAARLAMARGPLERSVAKLKAIVPPTDTTHWDGRFAHMLGLARAAEGRDGVVDVAILPVQPWLDVDEMGSAVVVTGTGGRLDGVARALAEEWWSQRRLWGADIRSWDEIVSRLLTKRERPWVLVDAGDATSGGSEGTSAEALARLLPHADSLPGPVLLCVVDPATVAAARAGARTFTIGVQRVPLEAEVMHVGDGSFHASGRLYPGRPFSMRGAAVLAHGDLRVVASCSPTMVIDDAFYACVGLDARNALSVQSKSIMSWRAAFAAEAGDGLYFDGPGQTPIDVRRARFSKAGRGCFPLTDEPSEPIEAWRYPA